MTLYLQDSPGETTSTRRHGVAETLPPERVQRDGRTVDR